MIMYNVNFQVVVMRNVAFLKLVLSKEHVSFGLSLGLRVIWNTLENAAPELD